MPTGFEPMKAPSGSGELPESDDWIAEPKWDGFRFTAGHHSGGVWLESSNGNRETARFPYLVEAIEDATEVDTILDGELVSHELGWSHVSGHVKRTTSFHVPSDSDPALTYVVFDVMVLGGEDVRALPFVERRELLTALFEENELYDAESEQLADYLELSPIGPATEEFYLACIDAGFEGVMAKRLAGRYRCGKKSADFRKIKAQDTIDVIVTDIYPPDAGSHLDQKGMPGKLGFGYIDPSRADRPVVEVGRVGTGFKEDAHPDVSRSDIRDNPDRWIDHVIEVGHMTVGGPPDLNSGEGYRHPSFIRRRDDKKVEECVWPDGAAESVPSGRKAASKPAPKTTRNTVDPNEKAGYIDSPCRSGTGRIRNLAQMSDKKFVPLVQDMIGSADREGLEAVMAEAKRRGM